MDKKLKEAIITTIITLIMTFIFNILLSNFTFDKGSVRLGDLIEVEKGKYMISIDIKNFSDNNIDKIRIKIPEDIDISSIKTNQPLNFSKISNNIGNQAASTYEIARVPEKQQVTFNIILNNKIDVKSIVVEKNNNKISVEYPNDINNSLKQQIKRMSVETIIYALIVGIMIYVLLYNNEKNFEKNSRSLEDKIKDIKYYNEQDKNYYDEAMKKSQEISEKYKNYCEEKEKESQKLMNQMENIKKEITNIKVISKKRELLLLARIKDYKKELDFWRDTIRKVFYNSQNKKIDSEIIFDEITNNLKTYQTKDKRCEDFDAIKVMANIIKNE
ncbi:hypothetical protein FDB64_05100 [Clostridium botulinum]|nr:hypothetical protein [Clostridium botulinum]NFM04131.1 hypothetical protein [Clostridium botulinum]